MMIYCDFLSTTQDLWLQEGLPASDDNLPLLLGTKRPNCRDTSPGRLEQMNTSKVDEQHMPMDLWDHVSRDADSA